MKVKMLVLAIFPASLTAVCLFSCPAFAQTPGPAPDPSVLFNAIYAHQWAVVVGFVLYLAFALTKQGWFGTWLQAKLPSKYYSIVVPLFGVLGTEAVALVQGTPWTTALLNGLLSGITAVMAHESVVEAVRGGKEIVPAKSSKSNGGGPASVKPVAPPAAPPPPAPPPAAAMVGLVLLALFASGCLAVPTVQVTPQNQAEVSGCTANANWHNASWIAAGGLGAAGAGLGAAGALTDNTNTQHVLAGVGIGVGVVAVGAAAVEAVTAANYAGANCQEYVTPIQSVPSARFDGSGAEVRW
jgi:hypothetical protein